MNCLGFIWEKINIYHSHLKRNNACPIDLWFFLKYTGFVDVWDDQGEHKGGVNTSSVWSPYAPKKGLSPVPFEVHWLLSDTYLPWLDLCMEVALNKLAGFLNSILAPAFLCLTKVLFWMSLCTPTKHLHWFLEVIDA